MCPLVLSWSGAETKHGSLSQGGHPTRPSAQNISSNGETWARASVEYINRAVKQRLMRVLGTLSQQQDLFLYLPVLLLIITGSDDEQALGFW